MHSISRMGPTFSKVAERDPKCTGAPAVQDFGCVGQFGNHFIYRVRIDELGPRFGGEVPRAEGVLPWLGASNVRNQSA